MKHSASTMESLAGPETRTISQAHRVLHAHGELLQRDPAVLVDLGRILVQSSVTDHIYDAGWAYSAAAQESQSDEQKRSALLASQISFKQAAESCTTKSAEYFRARLGTIFVEESMTSRSLNGHITPMLLKRVNKLQRRQLAELFRSRDSDQRGLASELTVMTLLMNHAADNGGGIVMPSYPWQDSHGSKEKSQNFDVLFQPMGERPARIQVKGSINQMCQEEGFSMDQGDEMLEYWRKRYDDDIVIIFGDVHLLDDKKAKMPVAKALAKVGNPLKREQIIDLATRNVLSEIDQTLAAQNERLAAKLRRLERTFSRQR